MKKFNVLIALLLLSFVSCELLDAQRVVGKGPVVTESIDLPELSSIGLGISANVYLTQGNSQSIKIMGQKNIIDLINKEAKGGSWDIKVPNKTNYKTNEKLEIHITLQDVESLNIGGSGSIIGKSQFDNLGDVRMNIGGSGSINMDIEGDEINCNIGGSGSIKLAGNAERLDANIGGSGSINAENLKVRTAKVNAAGSGSVMIDVEDELTATIVGSGGVKYKGSPKINKTVMGSGRIRAY